MKHFSLTDWADYVRGVGDSDQRSSMQKHLDQGCKSCASTVAMWSTMAEFSKKESAYEPPSSALRVAQSYLAPLQLGLRDARRIQMASITFDSLAHRALQGIRGHETADRQIMYQFGTVYVDMKLAAGSDSATVVLTGQIVDSSRSDPALARVSVALVQGQIEGRTITQKTVTNDHGEFSFTYKPVDRLMVMIEIMDTGLLMLLPGSGSED